LSKLYSNFRQLFLLYILIHIQSNDHQRIFRQIRVSIRGACCQ